MKHSRGLPFLALLCFALDARATQSTVYNTHGERIVGADHIAQMTGALGKAVAAEFTSDGMCDAAFLVGSQPVIAYNVSIHQALENLPWTCTDITAFPRASTGLRADLALVSPRGLERVYWDSNAKAPTRVALGGTAWSGALRVRCGDIDGSGFNDLIGLAADGRTLLILADPMSGAASSSFTLPHDVYDFDVIDWDGSGASELVAATAGGIRILSGTGASVEWFGGGAPTDRICVLRDSGPGADRLAGCVKMAGGQSWLYAIDSVSVDTPLFLGELDLVSMTSGDVDGDGDADLVLSQRNTNELLALFAQPAGSGASFSFAAGAYEFLPTAGSPAPAPENSATPAVADFDGDGDDDVLFPVQTMGAMLFFRSDSIDHVAQAPTVLGGTYTYFEEFGTGELALQIAPPATTPSIGATHLETTMWKQSTASSATSSPAESWEATSWTAPLPSSVTLRIDAPLGDSSIHNVTFRLIKLDASGAIVAGGPTMNWAFFTSNAANQVFSDLNAVNAAEFLPISLTIVPGPPSGIALLGSDVLTGSHPVNCVPCFDGDDFPDTGKP